MTKAERIPKVGDIVGIAQQRGTFVVSGVTRRDNTVSVTALGSQGKGAANVPWTSLSYRDELDESQNALRVVKEATEE
jgi:hypothetical protein